MSFRSDQKITREPQGAREPEAIRSLIEGIDTSSLKASSQMIVETIKPVLLSVLKFTRTPHEDIDKFSPLQDPFAPEIFRREQHEELRREAISALSIIYEDEADRLYYRMRYKKIWEEIANERESDLVQNNLWSKFKSPHRDILDYSNQSLAVEYERRSTRLVQQIIEHEVENLEADGISFLSKSIRRSINLRDIPRVIQLIKTFDTENSVNNETLRKLSETMVKITKYESAISEQFSPEEKEIIQKGHDVVIYPCENPSNTGPHLTTEFEVWSHLVKITGHKFHLVFNAENIGHWVTPIALSKFGAPITITVLGRLTESTELGTYSREVISEIPSAKTKVRNKYSYQDLVNAFVSHYGDAHRTITWAKLIKDGTVKRSRSFSDFLQTQIELPALRTRQILDEYDL